MHVFRDERESDWACQVLCCRYTEMGCSLYVDAIGFIKLWTINSIHYYGLVSWLSKINSHHMWLRTMLMHNSEYLQYKRYH